MSDSENYDDDGFSMDEQPVRDAGAKSGGKNVSF